MTSQYLFTVFTPTYNRAHTISRVYESLCLQTCRDFEWVVVDDGSTDDTAAVVAGFKDAGFPIRYVRQENRGKHTAFNQGVAEARGELFLSVDSDDSFAPHALERFRWHWEQIPPAFRDQFVGVTALCADQHGRLIGTKLPRDVIDSDSNEMKFRYGATGDRWGFQRVEILRRFPFPEVDETRFVPESVVWAAIAREYKTRYVNEVLHTYWQSGSAGAQISNSLISPERAAGIALWHRSVLNNDLKWFRCAPLKFLRLGANYSRFSFTSGAGVREQRRRLCARAQLLWAVALPLGIVASVRDRLRGATT
jgi:glycosyltransferase involved in cell wall biosynthesis